MEKKRMLGKRLKRARRLPLLASLRTHRSIQQNRFARNWRTQKLRLKVD
jgi:ribosomal protein L39E